MRNDIYEEIKKELVDNLLGMTNNENSREMAKNIILDKLNTIGDLNAFKRANSFNWDISIEKLMSS